jgi:hypothetical protein
MTALENRKAIKISQTVGLLYPEKIWFGATVLVSARILTATIVLTPIGTGWTTKATIVATKIASM